MSKYNLITLYRQAPAELPGDPRQYAEWYKLAIKNSKRKSRKNPKK